MSSPSDLICNFERNPYNLAYPTLTRALECGRWVARRPGDVCSATTEAERRPWTHWRLPATTEACGRWAEVRGTLLQRPMRSGAMNQGSRPLTALTDGPALLNPLIEQCGRWDLNPHDCNNHKILSLARLPVPTLPHIFDFLSLVSRDFDIISNQTKYVNT